jgi:hypothetical protein
MDALAKLVEAEASKNRTSAGQKKFIKRGGP